MNIDAFLQDLKLNNNTELKTLHIEPTKMLNIDEIVTDVESLCGFLNTTRSALLPYLNPITPFERYLNACVLIPKIVKIYNQENVLDWNNTDEIKYIPYIKKVGSGWVVGNFSGWISYTYGSFGHHYYSEKLCLSGIKNFNNIYLDFYTYAG